MSNDSSSRLPFSDQVENAIVGRIFNGSLPVGRAIFLIERTYYSIGPSASRLRKTSLPRGPDQVRDSTGAAKACPSETPQMSVRNELWLRNAFQVTPSIRPVIGSLSLVDWGRACRKCFSAGR